MAKKEAKPPPAKPLARNKAPNRSAAAESVDSGLFAKVRRNPGLLIFLSVVTGVITLLGAMAEVLDYLKLDVVAQPEQPPASVASSTDKDDRETEPSEPSKPPAEINPALVGIVEINHEEVWAAPIDPTLDLHNGKRLPRPAAVRSKPLTSPVLGNGQLSVEAQQQAIALTEWLHRTHGVKDSRADSRIDWFVGPGVRLDPTKRVPQLAVQYYEPTEPEARIRKLLTWVAPDSPQAAVAYLGRAKIEISGLAAATRTTREDIVCEDFPGVDDLARRIANVADAEKMCREDVASPLRKAERGTPTRTGCPLYLVGRPIDELIRADAAINFAPGGKRQLDDHDIDQLILHTTARYENAQPDEKQDRAADLVTAMLIEWIGRKALQSTQIWGVQEGWVLQYVEKPKDKE